MTVSEWFDINRLNSNTNETQQLLLSSIPNRRKGNDVQFLGVYLDASLVWKAHASNLGMKISRNTNAIRTLSFSLSTDAVRMVYFVFCSFLYNLFRLQRRTVRLVGGFKYRDCCRDKFRELKIWNFLSFFLAEEFSVCT